MTLTSQSLMSSYYPSQSLNLHIKIEKGAWRVQQLAVKMIYDAVECVKATQESCVVVYNNTLPTHFLCEGEVFISTLIFDACQIPTPSAASVIRHGSDTYQHRHSPYTSAVTWFANAQTHKYKHMPPRIILMFTPHVPSCYWPTFKGNIKGSLAGEVNTPVSTNCLQKSASDPRGLKDSPGASAEKFCRYFVCTRRQALSSSILLPKNIWIIIIFFFIFYEYLGRSHLSISSNWGF